MKSFPKRSALVAIAALFFSASAALAQSADQAKPEPAPDQGINVEQDDPRTAPERSSADEWVESIKQGGVTMIFIGLLSVLGVGCALERFVNLRRSKVVPAGFAKHVEDAWAARDFDGLAKYCASNKSAFARVVETMLAHRDSDFAEVKMLAEDKAGRELRLENRRSSMLATVATLAPLLGLFGTVVGLLEAFQTVAAVGEMGDASILADSIGKALVTTVAGLAVSMPALFVHGIFRNRLALYSVELEESIGDLVGNLFLKRSEPSISPNNAAGADKVAPKA